MYLMIGFLLGLLVPRKNTQSPHGADNRDAKAEQQRDSSNQIAAINSQTSPSVNHKATSNNRKKWWPQTAKDWAETLALIVLMFYTAFTYRIMNANLDAANAANQTLGEVRKQTVLMNDQLVGTQAATVIVNGPAGAGPLVTLGSKVNISIGLKNDGHVIAKDVAVNLVAKLIDLPSNKPVGDRQWPCSYVIDTLPPPTPATPAVYHQCFVDGLTKQDLAMIDTLARTIEVNGSFTYDNGFNEKRTDKICLRYSAQVKTLRGLEGSHNFDPCETFEVGREIILRHMKSVSD